MRKDSFTRLLKYLHTKKQYLRILDLGCGNAWMSAGLAKEGHEVTAMDLNKTELLQASRVFSKDNLELVYADIFQAPPLGKYDLIIISAALQYFKDTDSLFGQLGNYLKSEGELIIMDTFLYPDTEVKSAQQRSKAYFEKMETDSMEAYYFHHSISLLNKYRHHFLYYPEKTKFNWPFSKQKSPFPIAIIKGLSDEETPVETLPASMDELQAEILNRLSYFDLFKFPLRTDEIKKLLTSAPSQRMTTSALDDLELSKKCYSSEGYFGIHKNVESYRCNRLKQEEKAKYFLQRIPFFVKLMGHFPFVRAIAVSGSLSKGVIHEKGDTDYFIITKHNRLWIARTLLIIFKKLFLFNSKKFFCVNYFIGDQQLLIPDKNIFTATEIAFLVPVYNHSKIHQFQEVNKWHYEHYPNFSHSIHFPDYQKPSLIKRLLEGLLDNSFGDELDDFFLHLTLKRWKQKFTHLDKSTFELTMRSYKNVSKHHPQNFQTRVLSRLESKKSTKRRTILSGVAE